MRSEGSLPSLIELSSKDGGGRLTQLNQELRDPTGDVIVKGAHLFQRATARVGEVPVDVSLARDMRALVAAAHGYDYVRPFRELPGQKPRPSFAEIHTYFRHRLDDLGVDPIGRSGAR